MSYNQQLATAIETGEIATVKRLAVEHPARVNSPDWTPPPLHCSVLWNQPTVAEVLLDHGADIELLDPDRSTTAVRWAVLYAKPDMVRVLVARGAVTDAIVEGGTTLMQLAKEAAAGEYEEYDDMPSREAYSGIVALLEELGLDS